MDRHIDKSECDVSATLTLGYELHNMSDKEKEMWDLARSHTDEVLTYVGSNWEAVSKPTKQFIIAE